MKKSTTAAKVAIANLVVNTGRLAIAAAVFLRDNWPVW